MPVKHYTRSYYACDAAGCDAKGSSEFQRGLGETPGFVCHQVFIPQETVPRLAVLCAKHWEELLSVYARLGFCATSGSAVATMPIDFVSPNE